MKAAIFKGKQSIEVEEYPLRKLAHHEILIHVDVCGVCGTDHHIFNGDSYSAAPVILGHEYAGTIVEIKDDVPGLSVGDKVAIDPNIYCGYCSYCRSGKINLCENLTALGVDINGGFAEYSILPFKQAYKIHDTLPLGIAAFAEPLSCCIHGINQAEIKLKDNIVIIGAGSIGLLMLQLAKLSIASKVIVVEPESFKRELALQSGADWVFDSNDPDIILKVIHETDGGANLIFECAGNEKAANSSIEFAKKGSKIILFGMSGKDARLNFNLRKIFNKELSIKGSFLNPFTFGKAVELLNLGKINPGKFTTNQINLNEIHSVFSKKENSRFVKYQIIS